MFKTVHGAQIALNNLTFELPRMSRAFGRLPTGALSPTVFAAQFHMTTSVLLLNNSLKLRECVCIAINVIRIIQIKEHFKAYKEIWKKGTE